MVWLAFFTVIVYASFEVEHNTRMGKVSLKEESVVFVIFSYMV